LKPTTKPNSGSLKRYLPFLATCLLRAFLVLGLSLLLMLALIESPWLGKPSHYSQSFHSQAAESTQVQDLAVVSGVGVQLLGNALCLDKESNHVSDLEIITGRHHFAKSPREQLAPVSQQLLAATRLDRLLRPPRLFA
jgi:hypothetical protein